MLLQNPYNYYEFPIMSVYHYYDDDEFPVISIATLLAHHMSCKSL